MSAAPTVKPVAGRSLFYGAAALLGAALLLGGGSPPLHNLVVEWLALSLLALTAWQGIAVPGRAERIACLFLLLVLLTPLLQLVPLPYSVWSELPGRELAVQIDALAGPADSWRPLSLAPEATLLSAAYLLAPAAMFLSALRLDEGERGRLVSLFVVVALCSLGLAAVQIAAGNGAFHLYDNSHNAFATGFFANRNHQADLLLIAMIFISSVLGARRRMPSATRWGIWLAAVVGLSAGVIATMSRTGFLLLPLVILASASFLPMPSFRRHRNAFVAGGAAAVAAVVLVATSAGTERVMGRFDTLWDVRFDYWSDVVIAVETYFPWGSGIGTFDPVYRALEDLNRMSAPYFNLAHNDYLQVLLEAGLWGGLLIACFLLLFAWLAFRKVEGAPFRKAAAFSILILLVHSAGDYPLRMLSLLTLFGLLCALLFPARVRRS